MRKLTALLILCLFLTACAEPVPTTVPTTPTAATQYTIRVLDADGNPIAGALVGMCQGGEGGICYAPAMTGADGTITFPEDAVPVQDNIKGRGLVAAGFVLPRDENGEILYTPVPDGVTDFTLTLTKE